MSQRRIDPKATVTVSDYLTIERLIRERPSPSNLDKAVQLFPTCAIFWLTYLDFLLENPEKAIKVAERAVNACPTVDLWRRYLNLSKSMYRLPEVFPLYERAIASIGTDAKSSEFWIEYLYIIRALYNTQVLVQYQCLDNVAALPNTAILVPLSPAIPSGLNADFLDVEGLKIIQYRPTVQSIREIFQASLFVPMERIDAVWDEYQAYEQVIANAMVSMAQNMPTIGGMPPPAMLAGVQASKLLTEYSSRWGQSKQGLKELERIYAAINTYFAPLPLDQNSAETVRPNIHAWRRVLEFEKSNHFKLPYVRFKARMDWVLNQSLLSNVYVSEFWIEKCVFTLAHEGLVQATAVLETAIREYLANDVLLRLVLACLHEENGDVLKAQSVFTESLAHFTSTKKAVPALLMHYIRFAARCLSKVHARTIFLDAFSAASIHVDYKVVSAFAQLELRCFNSPDTARRVVHLGLAKMGKDLMAEQTLQGTLAEIEGQVADSFLWVSGSDSLIQRPTLVVNEAILQSSLMGKGDKKTEDADVVLDVSGEDHKTGGAIVFRPEVSKMMSFRPGMDSEQTMESGTNSLQTTQSVPKALLALLELIPRVTQSTVPDTDVVLGRIQKAVLPSVLMGNKRFEEDPQIDSIRRQREEKAAEAAVKRLLAANNEDNDDVIIKSDLFMDEEVDQRQFLSALASNIHRERINYKRHKIVAVE